MAQIIGEVAEHDSDLTADPNSTRESAETGREGQASPDPEQEPGDNKENTGGMEESGGAAEEHGGNSVPVHGSDKETAPPAEDGDDDEGDGKQSQPEKSPVQGSLASSTDSAQEGSRVLKQEQREGENVSSSSLTDRTRTAATKPEPGTKRRLSVELTSSDGEPLSRMDSEDRSVELPRWCRTGLGGGGGAPPSQVLGGGAGGTGTAGLQHV